MRRRRQQRELELARKRARQAADLSAARQATLDAIGVATAPDILAQLLRALDELDAALREVAPTHEPQPLVHIPEL
ncbi:MAG: hypothetical protein WB565_03775 [Acidimicrobiales bacterium]